jgi:hypothetical protein
MRKPIKQYLKLIGVPLSETKEILSALFRNFKLIPRDTTDIDEQIFLDVKFGFFTHALTDDEMVIYLFLWEWAVTDWRDRTNEKLGPNEFMTMDEKIWQYIRMRRLANKELEIDVTIDSPGFMAETVFNRTTMMSDKIWPRHGCNRTSKKTEDDEVEEVPELDYEEVQMFRVGDEEYTQEEYEVWINSLTPDKKVAMLGHVEPFIKKVMKGEQEDGQRTEEE